MVKQAITRQFWHWCSLVHNCVQFHLSAGIISLNYMKLDGHILHLVLLSSGLGQCTVIWFDAILLALLQINVIVPIRSINIFLSVLLTIGLCKWGMSTHHAMCVRNVLTFPWRNASLSLMPHALNVPVNDSMPYKTNTWQLTNKSHKCDPSWAAHPLKWVLLG